MEAYHWLPRVLGPMEEVDQWKAVTKPQTTMSTLTSEAADEAATCATAVASVVKSLQCSKSTSARTLTIDLTHVATATSPSRPKETSPSI